MSKMLMEMWSLNTSRLSEPATLDALRKGEMPDPCAETALVAVSVGSIFRAVGEANRAFLDSPYWADARPWG